MTLLGGGKRFGKKVYGSRMSGPNPNTAGPWRQIPGRYEERIFRFHQSHTQSLLKMEGADERAVERRGDLLMRPLMSAASVAVSGLFGFGISHLWSGHEKLGHHEGSAPLCYVLFGGP
jgi:hypothetical protein